MAVSADAPLTQKTHEILESIQEPGLREQVTTSVRLARNALAELGRLHLPQDHFEASTQTRAADDKHLELAPYVKQALEAINRLLAYLAATFPATEVEPTVEGGDDFDFDFDLVDDTGAAKPKTASAPKNKAPQGDADRIADAASAYGGMLRSRVLAFADRLRHALGQSESWPLLAELDDNHHRLTKSVQGVLFGMLTVFEAKIRREEILPEYRSAVASAVALRAALAELTYHITRFNNAISGADADSASPLLVALADRLARYATRPEYRSMRAEDKKAVIDVRQEIHGIRNAALVPGGRLQMTRLKMSVEGFSKFLESMQAINHRETLVLHDQQRLSEALATLENIAHVAETDEEAAHLGLEQLVMALGSVFGRNPELDELLRSYHRHDDPTTLPVQEQLPKFRATVEQALMTVG